MRQLMCKSGLAITAFVLAGSVCLAGPLNLKQVAANASWLGHVDFDAMRDSIVVQKAMAKHAEKHKHAEAHLKMVQALVGMDLKKDLHGATFYGPKVGKHVGVMILHANLDQKKLSSWAEKIPGREASEHNGHKISTWSKEHRGKKHTVSSAWFGDEHLVIGSSAEEVSAALDVLDGKAGSVGDDSGLAGGTPDGATVLMRVAGINEADLKCNNPVVKQTKSYRFVIGENKGESFYRARAEMTNTEVVGSLNEIVEGARALGRLHFSGNEQALGLVNGLTTKTDGTTLTVLWKGSAEDVWAQAEIHAKKMEQHIAKMREHHKKHHGDKGGKGDKKCEKCAGKCPNCEKCEDCKKAEKKDAPKKEAAKEEDAI